MAIELHFLLMSILVAVVTVFALYLLAKILIWSKRPHLRESRRPLFIVALVTSVTMVAILLLLEIELIAVFRTPQERIMTIVAAIDVAALLVVAICVSVIFLAIRRTMGNGQSVHLEVTGSDGADPQFGSRPADQPSRTASNQYMKVPRIGK